VEKRVILRFIAPRKIDLAPTPQEPVPHRQLFQSELIGISAGTELLIWKGEFPEKFNNPHELSDLQGTLNYPISYGYINVGRISDGQRVFAYAPHGDQLWVDPQETVLIGDTSAEEAIFLANMETALHLYQSASPYLGQRIAIWGLGVVGLLLCWLVRRFNLGEVYAFDPLPKRRELARELGIEVFDPRLIVEPTSPIIPPHPIELAFELSGEPQTLNQLSVTMAEEGKIVVGSWYGNRQANLELGSHFHQKRLSLQFSQVSVTLRNLGPNWDKYRRRELALKLIRELRPSKWITHRFPLRDASLAYQLLETNPQDCLQVVLVP